jgi:serine/threonine protein kinase
MGDFDQFSDGFPRTFGPYALLSAFAHGGMGEVYLAKAGNIEGIERLCVLKKLRNDLVQNEEYVKRFLDEARLVVQLNHANIAHVFDVGKVGAEYYLAMEYVSGVSLKELAVRELDSAKATPADVAVLLMAEALEGLDYAHRLEHPATGKPLNLVHRDVSPHNIMVSYEGEAKLIDFGLAASELKEEQTESQVVMGKVAYMAPEQARGERVNRNCDQFAAAICLYEALAGARFYGDMNNYQIWQVVGRGGYTPTGWADLDADLQPILGKALHPDPDGRFETCGDFKDALMEWLLPHHPKASRRRVRNYVREQFQDASQKERAFLNRFSGVNLQKLSDSGSVSAPPTENTASYSLVRAPGEGAPRAEHTMTATPYSGSALTKAPRGDTDSTRTHLLPSGDRAPAPPAPKRSRLPVALAAVALLAVGGGAGWLLVKPNPKAKKRPPVVAQPVAPVEPVEPVAPIEPVAPVEPVEPVAPIEPVAPVEPVEPVEPVDKAPTKRTRNAKRTRKTSKTSKTAAAKSTDTDEAAQTDKPKPKAPPAMSAAERKKLIAILEKCNLSTAKKVLASLKDPTFEVTPVVAPSVRNVALVTCKKLGP